MQSFGGCSTNCSFNITLLCLENLSSVMCFHGFSDRMVYETGIEDNERLIFNGKPKFSNSLQSYLGRSYCSKTLCICRCYKLRLSYNSTKFSNYVTIHRKRRNHIYEKTRMCLNSVEVLQESLKNCWRQI